MLSLSHEEQRSGCPLNSWHHFRILDFNRTTEQPLLMPWNASFSFDRILYPENCPISLRCNITNISSQSFNAELNSGIHSTCFTINDTCFTINAEFTNNGECT